MKKIFLISSMLMGSLFFQTLKAQGPAVTWTVSNWSPLLPNGTSVTQAQSGEDWWYGVKNYYVSGVHSGYVVCGYSQYNVTSPPAGVSSTVWTNLQTYGNTYCADYSESVDPSTGLFNDIECNEFETGYNKKGGGASIGVIALKDLSGNTTWQKNYNFGMDLTNVIQVSDGFIAIGTAVNAKSLTTGNSIAYNPTGGTPQYFTACPSTVGHAYVVKTDFTGAVQWEYLYGYVASNGTGTSTDPAYYNGVTGYNIIKASNGHLIITGVARNSTSTPTSGCDDRGFVMDLDANGLVLNKYLAPLFTIPTAQNSLGLVPFFNEFLGLTEIGTTGKYVIVGRQKNVVSFNCTTGVVNFPSRDYVKGIVLCLGSTLTPDATWTAASNNPVFYTGTGTSDFSFYKHSNTFSTNIWNVGYNSSGSEVVVPVISDCSNCDYTGAEGTCYLYRLSPTNGSPMSGVNPTLMGYVTAYDLRPDIHQDLDGGIIYTATTKRSSPPVTSTDLGPFYSCVVAEPNYADGYDTDAYIAKFNSTGVKLWEKYFDRQPVGTARVPYPGDMKRKECIFKSTVADDGGYVLAGTSSQNMEDDYLVKLKNDCVLSDYTFDITGSGSGNTLTLPTGATTWNSSHKVNASVIVPSGATLSISGATTVIEFADSHVSGIPCNIYIQNGGAINVSGGAKLTSIQGCTSFMWDGVVLQAQTSQKTQALPNVPQAFLSTGAIVENARIGFLVGDQPTNNFNGGILKCSTVVFRNNNIDAQFNPYIAPGTPEGSNVSYFNGCTFSGNNYLNDAASYPLATTSKHVILSTVKGIQFNGCNFGNNIDLLTQGYGIYSTDAAFLVDRLCNVIGPCGLCGGNLSSFSNMQYGIYAQDVTTTKTFTVNQTLFTNNSAGLYESGINLSTVTSNTFAITTTVPPISNHACTVAHNCVAFFHYLNGCSGFTHQENVHTVTGTTQHVVGTIFNGSATSASLTYKNSYSGLYLSQQIQGNNPNLQVQCNQSTNTTNTDIMVTSGTFPNQGASTCAGTEYNTLANNTFSRPAFSATSDINSATAFTYYFNDDGSGGNQIPTNTTAYPNPALSGCTAEPTFVYSTACPSLFSCGGGGGRFAFNPPLKVIKKPLEDGNAPELFNAIKTEANETDLNSQLLSKSPYLSDEVLIAYLNRPNLSEESIKSILVANSPLAPNVMSAVKALSLKTATQNKIDAAQKTKQNVKQQAKDLVAYYAAQKQYDLDKDIRNALSDTTAKSDTLLIGLLKQDNSSKGQIDLVSLYLAKGDYANAQTCINKVKTMPGYAKYGAFLQYCKDVKQQNKTWESFKADDVLSNAVTDLAFDSLSYGFANARAVLAIVKKIHNYEFIEPSATSSNNNVSVVKADNNVDALTIANTGSSVILKAYPNPFKDELTVSINVPETASNVSVQLIEPASGRVIMEKTFSPTKQQEAVFNTNELSSGLYLIGIKGNNIPSQFIKVVNLK